MNGYYTGKISSIDKQNGKVKVTFPPGKRCSISWCHFWHLNIICLILAILLQLILDENDNEFVLERYIPTVKNRFQLKNMQRRLEMYL